MKRTALVAAAAVLMLLAVTSTSTQACSSAVGVRYDTCGTPLGLLEVAKAPGLELQVWDANWAPVFEMPCIPDGYFAVTVPNCGPDKTGVLLHVRVGKVFFSVDKWEDWQWE